MNRELQRLQHLLRALRLLSTVEYLRYAWSVLKHWKKNRAFLSDHPGFVVPPKYLAYDAYSAPDWEYYYVSGESIATQLTELLKEHCGDLAHARLLEWGCGPARVVRCLPALLGSEAQIFGSDYNPYTIRWAERNIDHVEFVTNDLDPPLPFDNESFHAVYALSVFTHLSQASCLDWMAELSRILKDDGVLFFTTNSDRATEYLLPGEKKLYDTKGFVERGHIPEGKKMFAAFHAPDYVERTVLEGWNLIQHVRPGGFDYIHLQDAWLARKGTL